MNNQDMQKLLSILSKMDKSELDASLRKASSILNSKDADTIIKQIKDNTNK